MRRLIALLLILSLILTIGCAKPAEQPTPIKEGAEEPVRAEEPATEADITGIESDLEDIEDLDADFLETELDELDKALDFEI